MESHAESGEVQGLTERGTSNFAELGVTNILEVFIITKKLAAPHFTLFNDLLFYLRLYGPIGIFLWAFGNRSIWQLQMEIINLDDKDIAFSFKKLVQEESEIVAVAASIIAQVAVTALSLNTLSQAHWTARGSFTLSLVSAILAVYAASTEYRMFCRCVTAEDIKKWIKGPFNSNSSKKSRDAEKQPETSKILPIPSVASVITISAPFALMVVALNSILVGFGLWLGFVWTRNLDSDSYRGDSRAVFITYIVGLGICRLVLNACSLAAAPRKPLSDSISDLMKTQAEIVSKEPRKRNQGPFRGDHEDESVIATSSQPEPSHRELSDAFRQTAKLRRQLADSEERLADLYQRLKQE
ncbi:hypothetical protein F4680DRAFT_454888 [Xylaria scruposa]|nr:hypothetical protein F4680DRAFT_454888 [Xylaria scruposa]